MRNRLRINGDEIAADAPCSASTAHSQRLAIGASKYVVGLACQHESEDAT